MADEEKKDEKEIEFDQKQYDRLKASINENNGCKAWNEWREKNHNVDIKLEGAGFFGQNLSNANLGNLGNFTVLPIKVNLKNAEFVNANLHNTRFGGADLQGANFVIADINMTNFAGANIQSVDFSSANITDAKFFSVKIGKEYPEYKKMKWKPWCWKKMDDFLYKGFKYMDVSKMAGYTNPSLKREIEDYQFITSVRDSNKCWYKFWLYSSDCGRSIKLWAFWAVMLAIVFGVIFLCMGFESFHPFDQSQPEVHASRNPFTFFYFSIVTFTTLGFGDITPATPLAMFFIIFEVILGYVMLGGLISIFANKLARRA